MCVHCLQRIEGASSSEGSESEERAYKFGRQEILQTAERVFGDASEEYSQLGNVKGGLEMRSWYSLPGCLYVPQCSICLCTLCLP